MSIKIAMIGAGSIGFTRRLMQDVLTVPEFADTTFAMMDISAHNLDMVRQICERDIQANGLPAQSRRRPPTAAKRSPMPITSSARFGRVGWRPSSSTSTFR